MTDPDDIREDLEPGTPDDLVRLAEHLRDARPVPSPGFRGDLRRTLEARSRSIQRPARLRILIAGYAGAGTLLLLLGFAGAAGVGPLA